MGVDMVRMPPEYSVGFSFVLDFGNQIVRLPGQGGREAVATLEQPLRHWVATKGLFTKTRIETFIGFARARRGGYYGFRFWEPTEFSTHPQSLVGVPNPTDQYLGEGDGTRTRFRIRRVYPSTSSDLLQRLGVEDRMLPIIDEVDADLARKIGLAPAATITSQVAVDGVVVAASFDYQSREWVLAVAPGDGAEVTWGGYYDWPAAIDQETDANLEVIAERWESRNVPSIGIDLLDYEKFANETDDPGGWKRLSWASPQSPLIQKSVAKHWSITPAAGSLSCQVEEPRHNFGGPHLWLYNTTAFTVAVLNSMTGATMFTLGVAGSATGVAVGFIEDTGSGVQWRWILQG